MKKVRFPRGVISANVNRIKRALNDMTKFRQRRAYRFIDIRLDGKPLDEINYQLDQNEVMVINLTSANEFKWYDKFNLHD